MCAASQQSEVLLHTPAMRSDLQAVHYHRILRLKKELRGYFGHFRRTTLAPCRTSNQV